MADRVKQFFFTDLYEPSHGKEKDPPALQFLLAGFSARERSPEVWSIDMVGPTCTVKPVSSTSDSEGIVWRGQGEPLTRLIGGWNTEAWSRLAALGVGETEIRQVLETVAPLWHAAMPIQDAVDLVRYLIEVVNGYTRYAPGPLTVAPPIDLAAITVHEGFRWVARKHYYTPEYNPPEKYPTPKPFTGAS